MTMITYYLTEFMMFDDCYGRISTPSQKQKSKKQVQKNTLTLRWNAYYLTLFRCWPMHNALLIKCMKTLNCSRYEWRQYDHLTYRQYSRMSRKLNTSLGYVRNDVIIFLRKYFSTFFSHKSLKLPFFLLSLT